MKRILYILALMLIIPLNICSQDYYWYNGEQIPLQRGNLCYILYEEGDDKDSETLQIIDGGNSSYSKKKNLKWGIVSHMMPLERENVYYQIPSFLCSNTQRNIFITHRFYVKLKNQNDIRLLNDFVNRYNAEIEERDFPLWFTVRCGLNSPYNALELANIFYESDLFAVSEPEFMGAVHFDCVNDPQFYNQWNLYNTGMYGPSSMGVDINYCEAHSITTGNASVIVGVYDNGVDLTHPDINLYSYSYDANTETSPSQLYYNVDYPFHATACAGIIGAKTNNNLGVAGIAPNCPIMSLSFNQTTTGKIKKGFKTAANNGCAIISCSWSIDTKSNAIDEGISYALSQGRNGNGCVVVFSAGNEDTNSINYPANSNDSIIVVGAISPCGQRKSFTSCDGDYNWGSNYGTKLDVMAPGVIIPTTDIVGANGANTTDYMNNFAGTSAACPHVAAVAALILSVNPNLTQKEVADIIESTAQKIGSYSYTTNTNRPNGTWNTQMGYGLVDAYEAVIAATNGYIQGPDYVCDTTSYYLWKTPSSGSTISWSMSNSSSIFWTYSIVGPTNQDTVRVKCVYDANRNSLNNEDGAMSEQIPTRNFIPTLSATISNGSTSTTYTKEFRMPIGESPTFTSSSSSTWYAGTPRTFTITNCTDVPNSALAWTVKKTITPPIGSGYFPYIHTSTYTGRSITYTPTIPTSGMCEVSITATNTAQECIIPTTKTYIVMRKVLLMVNQEDGVLSISIFEESGDSGRKVAQLDAKQTYTLELWHNIYGLQKTQVVRSASEQMNIAGLPQGVYVLLLKANGNVIAEKKVKIQK